MIPILSLSLHDPPTGPPVRREKDPRARPYDRPPSASVQYLELPPQVPDLPANESEAYQLVKERWERALGSDPAARRVWMLLAFYGTKATHEYFWTLARESGRMALNSAFPVNTMVAVDSYRELVQWQSLIVLTMLFPDVFKLKAELQANNAAVPPMFEHLWFFSCNPSWNNGKIQAICADSSLEDIVDGVQSAYGFKEPDDDRCGTYNCFFPNVPVDLTDESNAVVRAIKQFNPDSFPSVVAVRAPQDNEDDYSRNETYKMMFDEVSELFLTLQMAARGITPPLHAAVPVFQRRLQGSSLFNDDWDLKRPLWFGYAYIGEAGWQSLRSVLREDLNFQSRAALGAAILDSVRTTSNNFVLLFDMKSGNMVVKKKMDATAYDVRMIDFGSQFTVNVNRFGRRTSVPTTSSDCVFFVNGLLLLNHAYKQHQFRRQCFAKLALEVAATWETMKQLGRLNGFCGHLAKHKIYGGGLARAKGEPVDFLSKNLTVLEEEDFFDELSRVFYLMVYTYGYRDNGRQVYSEETEPSEAVYIERILNDLKNAKGWIDTDRDKAELRDRVNEMINERAAVTLE